MAVVLTYDVDDNHTQIKDYLITQLGYQSTLAGFQDGTGKHIESDLPNTTLYHSTKNRTQAYNDLTAAAIRANAKVEKVVAFDLSGPGHWSGKISRF